MASHSAEEVTVSFVSIVTRFGPLVAVHEMPAIVAVTWRDDLPRGPYADVSGQLDGAVAMARELALPTEASATRWFSSHGNDGPGLLWPRDPRSPTSNDPRSSRRRSRVTIVGPDVSQAFSGGMPLAFRDNEPLPEIQRCDCNPLCRYRWRVPDDVTDVHLAAWRSAGVTRRWIRRWPGLADYDIGLDIDDDLLTVAQAASFLRRSPGWLYRLRSQAPADAQPPWIQTAQGPRYRRSDLTAWWHDAAGGASRP